MSVATYESAPDYIIHWHYPPRLPGLCRPFSEITEGSECQYADLPCYQFAGMCRNPSECVGTLRRVQEIAGACSELMGFLTLPPSKGAPKERTLRQKIVSSIQDRVQSQDSERCRAGALTTRGNGLSTVSLRQLSIPRTPSLVHLCNLARQLTTNTARLLPTRPEASFVLRQSFGDSAMVSGFGIRSASLGRLWYKGTSTYRSRKTDYRHGTGSMVMWSTGAVV